MKKLLFNLLKIIVGLYVVLCGYLYFYQESMLFFPQKLDANYSFNFKEKYQELFFSTSDGKKLNGLLFKSENTKGLIFYLHGNAGSLRTIGGISKTYTDLNYDLFILDYRGFGKSEGNLKSEKQVFEDNQIVYNQLKKQYNEQDIIILGYSIGSGMAAKLASTNKPKHLILQAPYYSMTDMMQQRFALIPTFLLKYKLKTNVYLKDCKMPTTLFHGTHDKVIYYGSSVKLKATLKTLKLITLQKQGHNRFTHNRVYINHLRNLLK